MPQSFLHPLQIAVEIPPNIITFKALFSNTDSEPKHC